MKKTLNQDGAALVIVLMMMTLFSLLGLTLLGMNITSAKQNNVTLSHIQAQDVAEMGLKAYDQFINKVKIDTINNPSTINTLSLKDTFVNSTDPTSFYNLVNHSSNNHLVNLNLSSSSNIDYKISRTVNTNSSNDNQTWTIKSTGTVDGTSKTITMIKSVTYDDKNLTQKSSDGFQLPYLNAAFYSPVGMTFKGTGKKGTVTFEGNAIAPYFNGTGKVIISPDNTVLKTNTTIPSSNINQYFQTIVNDFNNNLTNIQTNPPNAEIIYNHAKKSDTLSGISINNAQTPLKENVHFGSTLNVVGNSEIDGNVIIDGDLNIDKDVSFTVTGYLLIKGNLNIDGPQANIVDFQHTVYVENNYTQKGSANAVNHVMNFEQGLVVMGKSGNESTIEVKKGYQVTFGNQTKDQSGHLSIELDNQRVSYE